jgi:hypothetical protein
MARLLRVKAKAYELEQDDQTGIRCQSTDAVEQITTFSDCRAGIEAPRERTRERTTHKEKGPGLRRSLTYFLSPFRRAAVRTDQYR